MKQVKIKNNINSIFSLIMKCDVNDPIIYFCFISDNN